MKSKINNDHAFANHISDEIKIQMVLTSIVAIAALLIYRKTIEKKMKSKKLGNVY